MTFGTSEDKLTHPTRYSIAIFIHPNHETAIKPLNQTICQEKKNGSDQHQDNKCAWEHIKQRFTETYLT